MEKLKPTKHPRKAKRAKRSKPVKLPGTKAWADRGRVTGRIIHHISETKAGLGESIYFTPVRVRIIEESELRALVVRAGKGA